MASDYREYPAPEPLRQHLSCVWASTVPADAPMVAWVVPDASLDIMWIDGALVVAGPDTGAAPSELPAGTRVVAARFRPGAAPSLLGVPADELRDQRVDLGDVWGAAAARRLYDAVTPVASAGGRHEALRVLSDVLQARLPDAALPDPIVAGLVAEFGRSHRPPRVAEVARRLGVSERQLLRRCVTAVGYRPKLLDRVLRFQRFLALSRRTGTTLGLAGLAAAAGYADQAHLTRECRVLAARTPAQLVNV